MKTLNNFEQLQEFGICVLTSEACGLCMRILCDVTEEGAKLLREFFRMEVIAPAWNSGKSSVMLTHSALKEIWLFANVRAGKPMVFLGGHVFDDEWETHTLELANGDIETWKSPVKTWKPDVYVCENQEDVQNIEREVRDGFFYIQRTYTKSKHPGTGLDNRHAFTGRVE